MTKIRLGISACLMGEPVRYDGQHKHDHFLTDTLGPYIDWVPVCPEVECGLPVPREAMRLVGSLEEPRLMTIRSGRDLTDQMLGWVARRVRELEKEQLCGFVFKAKSPSSGMERVKVYNANGGLSGHGAGLFARAFMAHFPLLPVEDEGRLHDPLLRENFIERIFALNRYRVTLAEDRSVRALMAFHARHKLLIMSHSAEAVRVLGRLLAQARERHIEDVVAEYEAALLRALMLTATPRKHVNVLHHMLGYFKRQLTAAEKQELLALVEDFRAERLPLVVPVTLFQHYVRKYGIEYLAEQVYLNPHPLELKLRNHA